MPTDRHWKHFSVPQEYLDASCITSSPLMRLPTEVLIEIFDHADPVDQLALALACKHLLQASTLVFLKTSSLVGRKVSHHSSTAEDLLRRVKPLTAAGRPKKAWHICADCLRYRPTKKSYWKGKRGPGLDDDRWENWMAHWNDRYSLQCPECRYDQDAAPWIKHMEAMGRKVE